MSCGAAGRTAPTPAAVPGGPGLRAVPDEASLALVDAREETRRSRRLAEIAATIDLDSVLERTLTAATDAAGVDAAMAVVRQDEEEPLVATFGMTAREASRQPVTTSPSGGARAVRISYRYDPEDEATTTTRTGR